MIVAKREDPNFLTTKIPAVIFLKDKNKIEKYR